jgi:hypothetical protein
MSTDEVRVRLAQHYSHSQSNSVSEDRSAILISVISDTGGKSDKVVDIQEELDDNEGDDDE